MSSRRECNALGLKTCYQTPQWLVPLTIVGGLALISTLIFWLSDLDLRCAAIFYAHPPASTPWPQEFAPLWRLFYYGAPLLAAIIALWTMVILVVGRHRPHWRHAAIYVLLTLAIGPGLLINLVFKDHYGRPRPRQVVAFGGTMPYLPPLALGISTEEKSFPAGHASIGFSLCALWFLWRQKRPHYARIALWLSIILGLAMGIGRMAAGAHFLSDVLWAGFISFFTALVLYHFVLRIPEHEAQAHLGTEANRSDLMLVVYTSIGFAVLGGSLLAFPVYKTIDYYPPPQALPFIYNLRLDLRYANLTIRLNGSQTPSLHINGEINGFGLPTYKIDNHSFIDKQTNTLVYTLKQRGFFTELDTRLQATVNISSLHCLNVRVQYGDIRVIADRTIPLPQLPQLKLKTDHGQVWPLSRN